MQSISPKENDYINQLLSRYPALCKIRRELTTAYLMMRNCYEHGGKLLIAGNGGSAADSEHIAGELMKSFILPRPINPDLTEKLKSINPARGSYLAENLEHPLPAISLATHEALNTAYVNDVGSPGMFAQQILGYGREGDIFLGISTSGNSENILNAAVVSGSLGIKVIGLTGAGGGELSCIADVSVQVPETITYKIQELHLPVYHCWCLMLEEYFFGRDKI